MIRITVQRKENGWALSMDGHAEYCSGQDIVCAAASMLFFALAGRLQELGRGECVERCQSGEARVFVPDGLSDAFRVILCGFRMLQEKYPENVRIWELADRNKSIKSGRPRPMPRS